jgi:hypothetical protein
VEMTRSRRFLPTLLGRRVLDPRLCDVKKVPMYAQAARAGQFLGFSDEHSSTAGLVHLSVGDWKPTPKCKWASRWMHTRVEMEGADSGPFFCEGR